MELLTNLLEAETKKADVSEEVVVDVFHAPLEALPEFASPTAFLPSNPPETTSASSEPAAAPDLWDETGFFEPETTSASSEPAAPPIPVDITVEAPAPAASFFQAKAEAEKQGSNQFEIVIPTNDDKEIIAARAVERMARSAGFSPEAVNQMKTALIEACLSMAAAEERPDTQIYQRYQLDEEKMTITIANSVAGLDNITGTPITDDPERIWRLEVLRSLVDFVRLTKLDDGWRAELTRFTPIAQDE